MKKVLFLVGLLCVCNAIYADKLNEGWVKVLGLNNKKAITKNCEGFAGYHLGERINTNANGLKFSSEDKERETKIYFSKEFKFDDFEVPQKFDLIGVQEKNGLIVEVDLYKSFKEDKEGLLDYSKKLQKIVEKHYNLDVSKAKRRKNGAINYYPGEKYNDIGVLFTADEENLCLYVRTKDYSNALIEKDEKKKYSNLKFRGFGGYNLGDRFSGKNKVEESYWAYSAPRSHASSLEKLRPKNHSSYYLILEDMKLDKGLASFKKEIKIVATAITNKIVGLQMSYDTGWKGNFLDEYNKIIFALNKKFEVTGQTRKAAVRNRNFDEYCEYWCTWDLPGNIIAELFSNRHNLILKIYLEDYDLKLKNESEKYKKVSEIEKNENLRKQSETIDMSGFD